MALVAPSFSREISRIIGHAESAADAPPILREDGNTALVNAV